MHALTTIAASCALCLPQPVLTPMTAADVIAKAAAAYRTGPTAERMQITTTIGGRERRATITLRLDPGQPPTRDDAATLIELGPLVIHAHADKAVAISRFDKSTCATIALTPPLTADSISRALPPIPAPQLDLALADGAFARPLPGLDPVEWSPSASIDATRSLITISGSAGTSTIRASFDRASFRLRSLVATLPTPASPAKPSTIELAIRPVDAGRPESWPLDTAGRTKVPTLAELAPRRAKWQLGDPIADTPLLDAALARWSLKDALAAPDARAAALLAIRWNPSDAADNFDRAAAFLDTLPAEVPRPLVVRVALFDAVAFDHEAFEAFSRRELAAGRGSPVWALAETLPLTLDDTPVDRAILIVSRDGRLRAVVPLPESAQPAAVAAALADALRQ